MAEDIENITRKGKNEDSKKEDVYELPKIKKKKSFFRKLTKWSIQWSGFLAAP